MDCAHCGSQVTIVGRPFLVVTGAARRQVHRVLGPRDGAGIARPSTVTCSHRVLTRLRADPVTKCADAVTQCADAVTDCADAVTHGARTGSLLASTLACRPPGAEQRDSTRVKLHSPPKQVLTQGTVREGHTPLVR